MEKNLSNAEARIALKKELTEYALSLGFSAMRVSQPQLSQSVKRLGQWVDQGCHGDMSYLTRHHPLREDLSQWLANYACVLSFTMPYLQQDAGMLWQQQDWQSIRTPEQATLSRYAHGRDYHKLLRKRLSQIGAWLKQYVATLSNRAMVDSAPLFEVEIAVQSGLGWRGKHTLLLNRQGSMFFLGELLLNIPLPLDEPVTEHCGSCHKCIQICPTKAITAPYQLDARRCISYLTIEHQGGIPHEFRKPIGNRIFGCDDCQLVCPWNRFAIASPLPHFQAKSHWQDTHWLTLWSWDEKTFLLNCQGSALYRIGFRRWQRNLLIGIGNCLATSQNQALKRKLATVLEQSEVADPMLNEHKHWALSCFQTE